jgi:hypothetical protein
MKRDGQNEADGDALGDHLWDCPLKDLPVNQVRSFLSLQLSASRLSLGFRDA